MVNLKKWALIMAAAMMLTGCGFRLAKENEGLGEKAAAAEIEYLNPNYVFGSGNGSGYYYLKHDPNANYLLYYVDYKTLQNVPVCGQPNCSHDGEKCTAWFKYGGTTANVHATDDAVYIFFSGAPWDHEAFEAYGKEALPRLIKCELDGTQRTEITSFNAADAIGSLPATDGTKMYTVITSYDDTENTATKKIVTIDLATGEKTFDDSIQRMNLRIVGASERELVLEFASAGGRNAYAAYNVDTATIRELYQGGDMVSCVCKNGSCYLLSPQTGEIEKVSVKDGGKEVIHTDLLEQHEGDWMTLAYVTDRGYVVQAEEKGEYFNFLIDPEGHAEKQTIKAESTDTRDKMLVLDIFAQVGDKYLVSPQRGFQTVAVPGPDDITYGVEEIEYVFSLITQENFWNSVPEYEGRSVPQ